MDKLVIEGNVPLRGRVRVSGSKNAALPILLAGLLVPQPVRLRNVPNLKDIGTTIKLLQLLGCEAEQDGHDVHILAGNQLTAEAPYELVRTMRASVLCLGPLLARLGKAVVALPGGCAIGSRPVDLHLRGLERMGARFDLNAGNIVGHCGQLHGAHIHFDFPTVGGTENLLMAASLARGETILENAAREPEVVNLADFLNACGANIQGQGTSIIRVQGVDELHEADFSIMPDRIEAGTYMVAAVITDGELYLENCSLADLDAVVYKLREMGVWLQEGRTGVLIRRGTKLVGVDVMTQPFPGFPTDMQAQIMALTGLAAGSGVIKETIFENRFMHVQELVRMGAQIKVSGQNAMVRGVDHYTGAPVMASDLRASASLVLAGLAARGRTEVLRIYHLDRGYEQLEDKLSHVGARITRMKE